jgi:hypothetical protein
MRNGIAGLVHTLRKILHLNKIKIVGIYFAAYSGIKLSGKKQGGFDMVASSFWEEIFSSSG